eukprot:1686323-Rhodomonas_salina.2
MARSQPKAYREMLNEVMQEHFETEGAVVASLAGGGGEHGGKKGAGKKGVVRGDGASQTQVRRL